MKVLSLEELMMLDIPEPAFVVDGMFAAGAATLLSARAKAGKGLFMLDCARCITQGKPFLGRSVRQGPVIYFALEEPMSLVRDRIRKMLQGAHDLPLFVAPLDGSYEGQTFSLEDAINIGELRDHVAATRPVMVIIDVLREAHESDENDSGDMARVLKPVRQLAHEFNTCIVVTHHMNRDGKYRGSTAIPGAFDDQIDFRREDGDDEDGIRGLITGEGRHIPKLVQRVEFDQDTHHWRAIEGRVAPGKGIGIQEKILDVLSETDEWLSGKEIAGRVPDVSERSVQNELGSMRKRSYSRMQVRGSGTKSDPYMYHGILKREEATPPPPTNGPVEFDLGGLWEKSA